jgi:hypothetical protein
VDSAVAIWLGGNIRWTFKLVVWRLWHVSICAGCLPLGRWHNPTDNACCTSCHWMVSGNWMSLMVNHGNKEIGRLFFWWSRGIQYSKGNLGTVAKWYWGKSLFLLFMTGTWKFKAKSDKRVYWLHRRRHWGMRGIDLTHSYSTEWKLIPLTWTMFKVFLHQIHFLRRGGIIFWISFVSSAHYCLFAFKISHQFYCFHLKLF